MNKNDTQLSRHAYSLVIKGLEDTTRNYFEIGVFYGAGLDSIARRFPERKCYAVDPFIEDGCTVDHSGVEKNSTMNPQRESALAFVSELENTKLYITTSHDFKNQLTTEQITTMNIGTVLIDGNHSYEFVVNDYELALQLFGSNSGNIIFDDLDKPGVARAYSEFCIQHADRIIENNNKIGEAILVKLKQL